MTFTFRLIIVSAFCVLAVNSNSVCAQEQSSAEAPAAKNIDQVVTNALPKTEKADAGVEVKAEPKTETKEEGLHLYFSIEQNPEKMSGQLFSASLEDRKALPQSVYNWVLNNLGPTKNCGQWTANLCAEDFNLVSYEPLKEAKQFVILQHQFLLKQDRRVYYVLSADGELLQMQLSRDEKVTIKPNSSLVN